MQQSKKRILLIGTLSLVTSVGFLAAQPSSNSEADTSNITVPVEKRAQLSPEEMSQRANDAISGMQAILTRTVELQKLARAQKDVIKLNCVNDKLLQIKQLLNIAESARTDLLEEIARGDEAGRYHQYSQITITGENVNALRDEADACVGEEIVFLGPTEVQVDGPTIPDDPTKLDDFGVDLEPPAYASPFL